MQNADQRNTEWLRDGKVITKSSAIQINTVNKVEKCGISDQKCHFRQKMA